MILLFKNCALLTFSLTLFSSGALAQNETAPKLTPPQPQIIDNEITNKGYFSFESRGITPNSDRGTPSVTTNEKDTVYEWTRGAETLAAQFGKADDVKGNVWRLTEIDSSTDSKTRKQSFTGITTSFYKYGVRSKTRCDGGIERTAQCVTATRKFCENFKIRNKTFPISFNDEGAKQNMLRMGKECSAFADYLNETLDPNKILESQERAERDTNVVATDLKAISDMKSSLKKSSLKDVELKGMDAWFGNDDKVGASTTGMKQRTDRLKAASEDFKSLSALAVMCSETVFVEESPGAGWTLPGAKGQRETVR